MKLSFICPSNNQEMFDKCITKSLAMQKNRDFEVIRVDTAAKRYASAAAALNEGASRAQGEYLVFLHHDIVIESPDFIDDMLRLMEGRQFYVAGAVGAVPRDNKPWHRKTRCNIIHGENRTIPGRIAITEVCPLSTVDECFFVIPRHIYDQHPFLEFTPTWHLYAVEYCLWAHSQAGEGSVILLPVRLWHLSRGLGFGLDYYAAVRKLRRIYRVNMYTTVGAWPKNRILFEIRVIRDRMRRYWRKVRNLDRNT